MSAGSAPLTDLEQAALSAVNLACGLAFQHNDAANGITAERMSVRVRELIAVASAQRQLAEEMRQGKHVRESGVDSVRGQLRAPYETPRDY